MKFFLLALAVLVLSCDQDRSGEGSPMKDQIMIDPDNGSFLVYNRDSDNDGKPDPYYMIGPGDPEGFFYLGKKKIDNTREDSRQIEILNKMQNGGNAIYIQIVRSHGGDGDFDHNPWNDPKNPESGLNKTIIAQWRGWLDIMKDAGITAVLFIYDDGSHPFDDGGCGNNGIINEAEEKFIEAIVNSFEDFPNLMWVVQEEFKYVNRALRSDIERKPCTYERILKMKNLAALIKKYDDHRHIVGVHHNLGDEMHFAEDTNIDMYVQQADTRKENLQDFHISGLTGFDSKNRFVYVMGESFDWNHRLMRGMDRTTLRRMYYSTALAGGYHLVLGMFSDNDPSVEMLSDMRSLQNYFQSSDFNKMQPNDNLKNGDTDMVLTSGNSNSFILYSYNSPKSLGINGLEEGNYNLKWMDPVSGNIVVEENVKAKGDALFLKPASIGEEAIVFGKKL